MEKRASWLQRYVLPGLIFQSLVISGGYGTGAELNLYFLSYGPVGGLLGMCLVTFVIWAVVCAVTFEFSRVFKVYNYRSAFGRLLGRGWVVFELCYFFMLLLALAVITATAAAGGTHLFGLPGWVGTGLVSAAIIAVVLGGTRAVEGFLALWAYVLYAVYLVFLIVCFTRFGGGIAEHLVVSPKVSPGWALGGAKYAFYNLGMIPAVLFALHRTQTRREAVGSAVIAAAAAILPGILLLVAMSGMYPDILGIETPINAILTALDLPLLDYIFQLGLFGTLVETGAGLIKAVSDRFEQPYLGQKKRPPFWLRPLVSTGCVVAGMSVSTLGLTELVSKGYGAASWGFLAVFVLPMMTLGVWKIARARAR